MTTHVDRMRAEHPQRLAQTDIPAGSPAAARSAIPADQSPDRVYGGPSEETASLLSRVGALERALAAVTRPVESRLGPESRPRPQPPLICEIQDVVCRWFDLTPADLAKRPRPPHVSRARQIAIYLARQLTGKSFRALAHAFGDRTHPNLIRAVRTIERIRARIPSGMATCRCLRSC
jgi:chromosomal replication initiator protein